MSEPDFRSLAEVEDADVVRAATKRFRRQVLVRSLWLIAVVCAAVVIVAGYQKAHRADLSLSITRSEYLGMLRGQMVGNTSVTVVANRMSDGKLGLNFQLDPPQDAGEVFVVVPAPRFEHLDQVEETVESEAWSCPGSCLAAVVIPWPEDGLIRGYLIRPEADHTEAFAFSFADFKVYP